MLKQLTGFFSGVASASKTHYEAFRYRTAIRGLDESISLLEGALKASKQSVRNAREAALNQAIDDELKATPLLFFELPELPVHLLIIQGIHTIGDVLSSKEIGQIKGFTASHLAALKNVIESHLLFLETEQSLRLDADQLTPSETALIREVARHEKLIRDLPEKLDEFRQGRSQLQESLLWINSQLEALPWIGNHPSREEVHRVINEVRQWAELTSKYARKTHEELHALPQSGPEEPCTRFGNNSAWFFATLDSIAPVRIRRASEPYPRPPKISEPPITQNRREPHHEAPQISRDQPQLPKPPTQNPKQQPWSFAQPKPRSHHTDRTIGQMARAFLPHKANQKTDSAPKEILSGDGFHGTLPLTIAQAAEALSLRRGEMTALLRRYQQFGAQYLLTQKRILLGDDMGLGKTVQILAAICHLHDEGDRHFFVIAPNSVLLNWEREILKHTRLKPIILHGPSRLQNLAEWKRHGGIAVTTYGTVGVLSSGISSIDLLAVDEAHFVKNSNTKRNKYVRQIAEKSRYVALLSGTAIENRVDELHALVTLAQPKIREAANYLVSNPRINPEEARRRVAPVYLRRTQEDVLHELPELTHIDELIELSEKERLNPVLHSDNLMHRRQAATASLGIAHSAKYERLRELLDIYRSEQRKVVVFSYFRQVLDDVCKIAEPCPSITGDNSAANRLEIIDRFASEQGHAALALQIEAGGVGINLQCAQVVILMEPQLKPSTENQAIARVHRMGQSRRVIVHRMIAKNTVDEDLIEVLKEKQAVFDRFANPSAIKDESAMSIDSTLAAEAVVRDLQDRNLSRLARSQ